MKQTVPVEQNNSPTAEIVDYRRVPHNIEAEQALLGAALINNSVLDKVIDVLDHGHFYDPLHASIFKDAVKLYSSGRVASPITLKDYYVDADPVGSLTVPQYLGKLVANATTIINVPEYARTIKDLSIRRSLIIIAEDIIDGAYEGHIDMSPQELLEDVETRLYEVSQTGQPSTGSHHISESLQEAVQETVEARNSSGGVVGISTGIATLDRKTGGLRPTDLIVLAGRPAMGKTALAVNITKNVTMQNIPCLFCSLEMSGSQLAVRVISDYTGFASTDIRDGHIDEQKFSEIVNASSALSDLPLYIDETGGISIGKLAQRARRMKRQYDIQLIVIDYLQLMAANNKSGNRTQEITEITTGLKALAKELKVPIIALSQLSRQVENRDDKRPHLSDLRESGSIEQDADIVLFIYREEYYHAQKEPDIGDADKYVDWQQKMSQIRNIAEVNQAKHRHSSTGTVKLHFDAKTTKFADLTRRESA